MCAQTYSSDIDWEYPADGAQADALVALLKETRAALDALAKKKGDTVPYQLSVSLINHDELTASEH